MMMLSFLISLSTGGKAAFTGDQIMDKHRESAISARIASPGTSGLAAINGAGAIIPCDGGLHLR
jgi:hypothetical protein